MEIQHTRSTLKDGVKRELKTVGHICNLDPDKPVYYLHKKGMLKKYYRFCQVRKRRAHFSPGGVSQVFTFDADVYVGCMGCQGGVAPLAGGLVVLLLGSSSSTFGPHLTSSSHLWLQEAVGMRQRPHPGKPL